MKTITSIVWLTLISLLFSATASADATDREKLIERGKIAYLIYCSNCHGQDATGNGPVAHLLTGRSVVTEAHDRSARAMKWLVIDAVKGVEKGMASHSVS